MKIASKTNYTQKSAQGKKRLTLQVEVDEMGCVEPLEHAVMVSASVGTH